MLDNSVIIGGAFTIVGAVISPVAQKIIESWQGFPVNRQRIKSIRGSWAGSVQQYLNDAPYKNFPVDLDFKISGKRIHGTGIIKAESLIHVLLTGSFRNDRFLKMNYENKDSRIIQFGSFLFHLSDDSRQLTGKFVGYGHQSNSIIYGNCEFSKD